MRVKPRIPLISALPVALIATGAIYFTSTAAKGYPRLETTLLGSSQLIADSKGSLRVACRDHIAGKNLPGANVRIALKDGQGQTFDLYYGRSGSDGTVNASFNTPRIAPGSYTLEVTSSALGETDRLSSAVTIQKPVGILITTDKPIYQPGQTIHLRSLALWTGTKRPAGNVDATLEIEDAKGNKVFKKSQKTSPFGLISADFQLASEINLGQYKVRTVVGDSEEEKTIAVDRYVLPKFKVGLVTDKEYYTPGGTLSGTVDVNYIFGKPVVNGRIEATLSTYDVGFNEFAKVNGKTDAQGRFHLEQKLPDHFVGQPLEQGNALVKIDVKVTDTADHEQTLTRTLPIAKSGLILNLIPERETRVPGLDFAVYVVASTPDGMPAAGVTLTTPGSKQAWVTNAGGLAELRLPRLPILKNAAFQPETAGAFHLAVKGVDRAGNDAQANLDLQTQYGDGIILRPFQSLVKAGDPLYSEAIIPGPTPTGTVFFDVVKDGRTVLSTTRVAENGVAKFMFRPTEDLAGTIRVLAYYMSYSGQIVRDSRVVFVSPSTDLNVKISADRETYRPGEKTHLILQVGRRGASAVGLSIVDESVFALQEMQPGMERVYFLLEQELLHPRYEIHSITPGKMFEPGSYDKSTQLAARAMFAQAKPVQELGIQQNSYYEKIAKFMPEWENDAHRAAKVVHEAAKKWQAKKGGPLNVTTCPSDSDWKAILDGGLLRKSDILDPWKRPYRITAIPHLEWDGSKMVPKGVEAAAVTSAGLDGRFDTADDFAAYAYYQYNAVYKGSDMEGPRSWNGGVRRGFAGGGAGGRMAGGGEMLRMEAKADFARDGAVFAATAAPGAPMEKVANLGLQVDKEETVDAAPRMRQYFPETLYWNPSVITDDNGRAELDVPLADSITTWRISASAINAQGQMGSSTAPIRVFQDFFVDIDLPVALTQNDEVDVPVAVYNYLPNKQTIEVVMEPSPGMEMLSDKTQKVTMGPNDVRAVYFRFRVVGLGMQKLTVRAKGDRLADAMQREIEVLPDGRRQEASVSDRLSGNTTRTLHIPENAIDGASNLLVKVYPGVMSTVVEGLDKIFQMPYGCFEQTSSTTYPNVLVLDYMKKSRQITPTIQMKAEQYINLGYQRLLSFEVRGGGFEWFGNAPAHKVLTAYGLLEFNDMAKVYGVDPNLIARTQAWLESAQNADGSWKPDSGGIAEGAINRQSDVFKTTAYIAWAMAESGSRSAALGKALMWLSKHQASESDPYALALTANAQLAAKNLEAGRAVLDRLISKAQKEGDKVYFGADGPTAVYSQGKSGDVETTALAVLALLKAGGHTDLINKSIGYLISAKDPNGTWYSTQATVFALKALIASAGNAGAGMNGEGRVWVNGQMVGTFVITPQDYEVVRQFDAKSAVCEGDNEVKIEWSGKDGPMFQISGLYYTPWSAKGSDVKEEMDIQVQYDRHELAANDTVWSKVRVEYRGKGEAANMVIVDLGIPPGFDLQSGDLQELVGSKVIQKYNLTARQAILYFDKLVRGQAVEFKYRLKAKYPLRARTPASRVYEYYNPEKVTYSAPQTMNVTK